MNGPKVLRVTNDINTPRATLCIVNVMRNSGAAQVVDEEGVGGIE